MDCQGSFFQIGFKTEFLRPLTQLLDSTILADFIYMYLCIEFAIWAKRTGCMQVVLSSKMSSVWELLFYMLACNYATDILIPVIWGRIWVLMSKIKSLVITL